MDGITGIYAPGDPLIISKAFLATGSVQHRGKTAAGMAVGTGKGIYIHKGLGGMADVVDADILTMFQDLGPTAVIGNVGYTKHKMAEKRNAEPILVRPRRPSPWTVALTMEGVILTEDALRAALEPDYYQETASQTELVGALLHRCIAEEGLTFAAGGKLVAILSGAGTFTIAALVYDGRETALVTLNDDRAFEPFCHGTIDGAFVASSESCSLRRLGGDAGREYGVAEMTIASSSGVETRQVAEGTPLPDAFQGVYFGNVSSIYQGREIFQLRKGLGLKLAARYKETDADVVIPNPDSGRGVAYGIAEGLRLPMDHGLVKQAQAIRTFQESLISKRTLQVGLKFAGVDSVLRNRRVIMGDDSIVKGSVSEGGSVWTVYNSGAKRLEFWVSYGPMFFPSFKEWRRGRECLEELAVQRAFKSDNPYDKTVDQINVAVARLVGVDRVCYNTPEDVAEVTGPGSFGAMDASYPVSERHFPDWLKVEVEAFRRYRSDEYLPIF
jgi:amidophosphoribosyltransferase